MAITRSHGPADQVTDVNGGSAHHQKTTAAERSSLRRQAAAWAVHTYTGLGLLINFYAALAMFNHKNIKSYVLANWLAVFVDGTDGSLARWVNVKKATPQFDGALLDNIIDFMTFTFQPCLALVAFNVVSEASQALIATLVLLASSYQFCYKHAKTDQSFVGFPSYWNIVFLYIYYLRPSEGIILLIYASLAVLSFVPIHFVYPTRTKFARTFTLSGAAIWGLLLTVCMFLPHWGMAPTLLRISLVYPLYYTLLSLYLHFRQVSHLKGGKPHGV